jgi:hypothetical protein
MLSSAWLDAGRGFNPEKGVGGWSETPLLFGKKSGWRGVAQVGGGISGTPI